MVLVPALLQEWAYVGYNDSALVKYTGIKYTGMTIRLTPMHDSKHLFLRY